MKKIIVILVFVAVSALITGCWVENVIDGVKNVVFGVEKVVDGVEEVVDGVEKIVDGVGSSSLGDQSYGSLPYEGQIYRTVVIGTQTWMAENLNYAVEGSVCYDNKAENCTKYGRLYDWNTAKNACPDGWHLPSDKEWNELMTAAGGENVAGIKLRAKSGWDNNGTDDYGFAALPGGEGSSIVRFFSGIGTFGYWWSATESSSSHAYTTNMDLNRDKLRWDNDHKSNLSSVRCVQD